MKKRYKALIFIGGVLALAALACMVFLPSLLSYELRSVTGFAFRVRVLTVNPFTGRVVVRGLAANNPPGFPKPDFVELRELNAQVEVLSWMFPGRNVIDDLDLDIGRIVLVRRHDGKTNAGEFIAAFNRRAAGSAEPAPVPAPRKQAQYLIKNLRLRLDQLAVADYSGAKLDEKTYELRIDQSYSNVTGTRQLFVPDVIKTLHTFGLHHDIARLLPGEFGTALAAAVGGVAQVGGQVKEAVKKTGDNLKGLIDKLEQSPKQ
jgi:hypothetical protein